MWLHKVWASRLAGVSLCRSVHCRSLHCRSSQCRHTHELCRCAEPLAVFCPGKVEAELSETLVECKSLLSANVMWGGLLAKAQGLHLIHKHQKPLSAEYSSPHVALLVIRATLYRSGRPGVPWLRVASRSVDLG